MDTGHCYSRRAERYCGDCVEKHDYVHDSTIELNYETINYIESFYSINQITTIMVQTSPGIH